MIEFGNREHALAIATRARCQFNPMSDVAVSRTSYLTGNLMGGVIFNEFTGVCIAAHLAGFEPNWVSNDLLWISFNYPFVQLKCKKMLGFVPSSNREALAFNDRLGFKEETRIRDVYPDGDMVVLAMKREDCRWLGLKPRHFMTRQE